MTRVPSWLMAATALLLGTAMVTAACGQAPQGRRGSGMMRGSFLGLLRVEKVQQELKLSEEQIGKLQEIGEKLRAEMGEKYAGLREIEDRQKRREKMTELLDEFDEKAREQVREVLSEEQMMRLYQIRLQVRGTVYALRNRYVARRLELTDEQKKKAAELEKATQEKVFEVFRELRDASWEQRREKINKIRSEAGQKALGLLTPEQKEALEKMKGKKLEL